VNDVEATLGVLVVIVGAGFVVALGVMWLRTR